MYAPWEREGALTRKNFFVGEEGGGFDVLTLEGRRLGVLLKRGSYLERGGFLFFATNLEGQWDA